MGLIEFLHFGVGATLAAAGWLIPRHIAGARRLGVAMLVDALPLALGAVLLGLATGRPLFAGMIVLALGAGFALADHVMRQSSGRLRCCLSICWLPAPSAPPAKRPWGRPWPHRSRSARVASARRRSSWCSASPFSTHGGWRHRYRATCCRGSMHAAPPHR